jgi:hypothetical protein
MGGSELVDLGFSSVETETADAWLIVFEVGTRGKKDVEAWMPKSQCEIDEKSRTIAVPLWLVEKKGLEAYS